MDNTEKLKIEYINKKQKIQERLNQFEKFFSEPYSWHYASGELKLLPSEAKDDYRLFEELAFCIFTANASAEDGLEEVDKIRNVLITGNVDDMTRRLENYRFNKKRPQYIVHTREHLKNHINFELKKKISLLKNINERRDFFVKNVKVFGMKEASHFLRNIGFKGYAILDKHIINSLHEFEVIEKNEKPKNSKEYLEIEQKFIEFSKQLGIDMDELDLLLWSMKNGRILK